MLPDKQEFWVRVETPIETIGLCAKWNPIPVHYIGNRVPFGTHPRRTVWRAGQYSVRASSSQEEEELDEDEELLGVRWAELFSTHTRSVHLLFLHQFGGVHKVTAVEDDDRSGDSGSSAPEQHIGQGLSPRVTWEKREGHHSSETDKYQGYKDGEGGNSLETINKYICVTGNHSKLLRTQN